MKFRMLFACIAAVLWLGLAGCGEYQQGTATTTSGPNAGSVYPTPTGGGY